MQQQMESYERSIKRHPDDMVNAKIKIQKDLTVIQFFTVKKPDPAILRHVKMKLSFLKDLLKDNLGNVDSTLCNETLIHLGDLEPL